METEEFINKIINAFSNDALDFTISTEPTAIDNQLLLMKLAAERFSLKDIPELTSRVFNHWKTVGLMPLVREEGKSRFSFIEYIWLQVVLILREFGYPLDKIARVRHSLFNPTLDFNKEYADDYYVKFYETEGRIQTRNILGISIAMLIINKEPVSIIVAPNGQSYILKAKSIDPHSHPFISVPLLPIIREFIYNTKDIENYKNTGILNEKELFIINQIRRNDIHEVIVKNKDGEPKVLKVTKKSKDMTEKEVTYHITKYGYKDIYINKTGGKNIVTITTNYKLK